MGLNIALRPLKYPDLVKFDLLRKITHSDNLYDGIHFIFHNTDELITKLPSNQQNFFGKIDGTTLYWIKPKLTQIDDSMKTMSLDE